MIFLSFS
jgi:hypothetical protein